MTTIARFAFLLLCASLFMAAPTVSAQKRTTKKKPALTKKAAAKPSAPTIARDTEMKIRLQSEIDTKKAQDGDKFTAVVIDPSQYADAIIEGHIAKIAQSGKLKGKTAISLSFDTIKFKDGTSTAMAAQVVKVYGEDSVKKVDEEGNVQSGSKTETTVKRTGGGAAAGAVIGAIAGGGKGAAIGAAIGAGVGAGSTYIQGSNKIKLESGTEILIKTTK
jgi:hypothetical protein